MVERSIRATRSSRRVREASIDASGIGFGATLRLTVPGEAEHVCTVRRTACAFASHHRVLRVGDVASAIGEAAANVVLHAYINQPPGPLHLTGFVDEETALVYLVVADEGSGLAPRIDWTGLGLGLPIIARATDHVEITERPDTGTVLTMGFVHTPAPEPVEREIFEQARHDIAEAIEDGGDLDTVEQRIAHAPLSADTRDALWLSAWATAEHEHQHDEPRASARNRP